MRVALVHDWLNGMRGGERCLEVFATLFPQAEIFTLFHEPGTVSSIIESRLRGVSVLQRIPQAKRYYRHLLPFYSVGVKDLERQIATRGYDLVISVSHCVAKNVRVPAGTFHLSYCLTPVRYLWDKYDDYFRDHRAEPLIRRLAEPLRRADLRGAEGVHRFVAISEFVAARIQRVYGRSSDVVYPPVRTDWISPRRPGERGEGYLVVNALVPYKRTDVIVEAFTRSGKPLTVIGAGPEEGKLRGMAGANVRFIRQVSDAELAEHYRRATAMIFAAEEDFGMTPVESLAAGRPVICYGRGGALETVPARREFPVGVHFSELTCDCLNDAVEQFDRRQDEFTVDNCTLQAEKFSLGRFVSGLSDVLERAGLSELAPAIVGEARATRHG